MTEFLQENMKVVSSVAIVIALMILKMAASRLIHKRIDSVRARYVWRQSLNVAILTMGSLLLVYTWFDWFRSMMTLLSLVAAALVIINKELLLNLFSYSVLVWRGVFVIGDRITIDDICGDVLEIGPFYFELSEIVDFNYTGRTVRVPNSLILTKPLKNDSRAHGIVWHNIEVTFDKADDPEKVRDMLLGFIRPLALQLSPDQIDKIRKSKIELPFTDGFSPAVRFYMLDNNMVAVVRYLCDIHKVQATQSKFWEAFISQSVDDYEEALT